MSLPAECVILAIEVFVEAAIETTEGLKFKFSTRPGEDLMEVIAMCNHAELAGFPCMNNDREPIHKYLAEKGYAYNHT